MKRIGVVAGDKGEQVPIFQEEIEVKHFLADGAGNLEVITDVLTVPMNASKFAQAAMMLGFCEYFAVPTDGQSKSLTALAEESKRIIAEYHVILAKSPEVARQRAENRLKGLAVVDDPKSPAPVKEDGDDKPA